MCEHLVQIVGYQTIPGPLREESDGDDDPQALAIARLGDERLPANVVGDGSIELEGSLDLLDFVLDEGVLPVDRFSMCLFLDLFDSLVTVRVVVSQNL